MNAKPFKDRYNTEYIVPAKGRDEEIRLGDIWRVIVRRRWIIVLALVTSLLSSGTYLFFMQQVFTASAYLLPPRPESIQGLLNDYGGLDGLDVQRYTPEFVYGSFLKNLKSWGLRRQFFDAHQLAKHYAPDNAVSDADVDHLFFGIFAENLDVRSDKSNPSFVTVSLSDTDPKLAAQWLNELIEYANKRTIQQIVTSINAAIQAEIGRLSYQLTSRLKLAEKRRSDTIVRLKEALRVAQAMGIKNASVLPEVRSKTQEGVTVNVAEVPLYMRGAVALETEISALESRKSDEPFIEGFRDLQERVAYLESVLIDKTSLSAVTVDDAARIPGIAEKPAKLLVVIFSVVFGGLLGMVVALVVDSRANSRREEGRDA